MGLDLPHLNVQAAFECSCSERKMYQLSLSTVNGAVVCSGLQDSFYIELWPDLQLLRFLQRVQQDYE